MDPSDFKIAYNPEPNDFGDYLADRNYLRKIQGNGNEFITNAVTLGERMGLSPYKAPTEQELNAAINKYFWDNEPGSSFFLFLKHRFNPETKEIEMKYPGYV